MDENISYITIRRTRSHQGVNNGHENRSWCCSNHFELIPVFFPLRSSRTFRRACTGVLSRSLLLISVSNQVVSHNKPGPGVHAGPSPSFTFAHVAAANVPGDAHLSPDTSQSTCELSICVSAPTVSCTKKASITHFIETNAHRHTPNKPPCLENGHVLIKIFRHPGEGKSRSLVG